MGKFPENPQSNGLPLLKRLVIYILPYLLSLSDDSLHHIAFVKPYIFSVLPAGSVATNQGSPSTTTPAQPAVIPTTVLQIRSSISLLPTQTIPFPFDTATHSTTTATAHTINSTVRLMTPTPTAKSPLFLVTTPMDRSTATAEGSCIWQFTMKSWEEQLDELVQTGHYADALALLETIDEAMLPDKVK